MKFLNKVIALSGLDHSFYRVYGTVENSYFAEVSGQEGIGWHFHRMKGKWVANDPDKQYQVDQLGEEVKRRE